MYRIYREVDEQGFINTVLTNEMFEPKRENMTLLYETRSPMNAFNKYMEIEDAVKNGERDGLDDER